MKLTPRGAVILGGSTALLVFGLLKGNGVLVSLGLAGLLLLFLAWPMGRWNLRGLGIFFQMPPRVFANESFDLTLTVQNRRSLLDAFDVRVRMRICGQAEMASVTSWAPAGSGASSRLRGSLPARGAVAVHPTVRSSGFPLGLWEFKRTENLQQEILVFPQAIVPKEFFRSGQLDDAWMGFGLLHREGAGELRGLRPFQPGDSAKNIHWAASARALARGDTLRMRENEPSGLRPHGVRIVFHSFGTDGEMIRTDYFERALSLLCGSLRHVRRLDVPVSLQADFLDWVEMPINSAASWHAVLCELARAKRASGTEAHELAGILQKVPTDTSLIVISDMSPERWKSSLPANRDALCIDVRQHAYRKKSLQTKSVEKLA